MIVGFSEDVGLKDGSGKHKFLHRLSLEFIKNGIKISNKNPDIFLYIPGAKPNLKSKINIIRLDGLIINNKQDYVSKNKKIIEAIEKSDAIVFQNDFCKTAYLRFLKFTQKTNKCIMNGASKEEFLERSPQNFILANCKWRPHKRLNDTIAGFLHAIDKDLDCDLVVTGDVDNKILHKRIKYVGYQNSEQIKILLSGAIATTHLSWIDWCPNAMVESIISGCPVIYSSSGGHSYLGKDCGIEIKDSVWDFKPCDYYNPPPLNKEEISNAFFNLKNKKNNVYKNDLDISFVANEYIKFFREIL